MWYTVGMMDFYERLQEADAPLNTVPKRAIVLPLGETVHVEWQATNPAATDIRVTFSE